MANGTTSTKELLEINKFKSPETPNNDVDVLEAARIESRKRRRGAYHEAAREIDAAIFEKEIKPALKNFEEKTGFDTGVNPPEEESKSQETKKDVKESAIAETPASVETDESELDDDSLNVKVARTVNGKRVVKTVGEWLELGGKVEQADQYLEAATKERAQAGNQRSTEVLKQPPTVDLKDIVKAVQQGTEAEAEEALNKVINAGADRARQAQTEAEAKAAGLVVFQRVCSENTDLSSDPIIWNQVCSLEGAMDPRTQLSIRGLEKIPLTGNATRDFETRIKKAVELTRHKLGSAKKQAVEETKKQQLTLKKRQLASVNQASARVESSGDNSGVKTWKTPEEYNAYVASEIAKKRALKRR